MLPAALAGINRDPVRTEITVDRDAVRLAPDCCGSSHIGIGHFDCQIEPGLKATADYN